MSIYTKDNLAETEKKSETAFSSLFFRLYDRKIASGEITFSSVGISKASFTALCTDKEFVPDTEEILKILNNMKLREEEVKELLFAAGYELI